MSETTIPQGPIGVFDSGLGGLTVLAALRRRFPAESFLYLGDVARLPYGTKSASVVSRYAETCVRFLLRKEVRAVVIACNTASAAALPALAEHCPVPVFGVVEPGARAAARHWKEGVLVVLATSSTIRSGEYQRRLRAMHPDKELVAIACPLLVPLAESGWFDDDVTVAVIRRYLAPVLGRKIDAVLFGCTHYPLLVPSFRKALGEGVVLVDSADELATVLEVKLGVVTGAGAGSCELFATDEVAADLPLVRETSAFSVIDLD